MKSILVSNAGSNMIAGKSTTPRKAAATDKAESVVSEESFAASSSHLTANKNVVSSFERGSMENIKAITEELHNNLELQVIVKGTISEYHQNKKLANDAGVELSQLVNQTQQKRKRKHDDDDEDGDEEPAPRRGVIDLSGVIGRNNYVFGKWRKKNLGELIHFCDPDIMDTQTIQIMKLLSLQQSFECATDIKLFGDEQDRVGCSAKKQLFENIKRLYERNGRRFRFLVVSLSDGKLDLSESAPWKMISQDPDADVKVHVQLATWCNGGNGAIDVKLTDMHLFEDRGPFVIEMSFSVRQASLKSQATGESYCLINLAPAVRRRLAVRVSDDEGATNCASHKSYQQAREEILKERALAKAPKQGNRVLGGADNNDEDGDNNDELPVTQDAHPVNGPQVAEGAQAADLANPAAAGPLRPRRRWASGAVVPQAQGGSVVSAGAGSVAPAAAAAIQATAEGTEEEVESAHSDAESEPPPAAAAVEE